MAQRIVPHEFDDEYYWQSLHRQPLDFWQPYINEIVSRHQFPTGGWQRSPKGRNIVFLLPEQAVLKVGPPNWTDEMARELEALRILAGKLPVATPEVYAAGEYDGWGYFIMSYIPGRMLADYWLSVSPNVRAALAHQHGQLGAALHALPANSTLLAIDWPARLQHQADKAVERMRKAGVDEALIADLPRFLAKVGVLHRPDRPDVLLTGDLSHINLMVTEVKGKPTITGLVDLGDTTIGQAAHEFISPLVHQYHGERQALHAFYRGYGFTKNEWSAAWQEHLMARIAIYYAAFLPHYFASLTPSTARARWEDWAIEFCQIVT